MEVGELATPPVVGSLIVFHAQAHSDDASQDVDRTALRAFGDLAALAITVARIQEQEQTLLRRLQALDHAANLLASDLEPQRLLRRLVEVATELVGARSVSPPRTVTWPTSSRWVSRRRSGRRWGRCPAVMAC